MIIIKLGGSAITDKGESYSFNKEIVARLAGEIKRANKKYIIIHGAGSFGHVTAEQFMLNEGLKDENQIIGFSLTHVTVRLLNLEIIDIFLKNGVRVFSIPPSSVMRLNDHQPLSFNYEIFEEALDKGFTPITFGDVVFDEKIGFSICSGDLLAEILAAHFKPEKVIFVIDEDGLYTSNPKIDKNARFIKSLKYSEIGEIGLERDEHPDVTGGMQGKVNVIKKICQKGIDCVLVNGRHENRLYNVILGEPTRATIVYGEKK